MQHVYGVINSENCHIDVSNTERGAKNYATRHGYKAVSMRYNGGYTVELVAKRVADAWVTVDYE